MRILMTTDTVGGVWSFTRNLCEELCGDHELALVSFGREPSSEQKAWVARMRTLTPDSRFEFWSCTAPLEWAQDNEKTMQGAACLRRAAMLFNAELLHTNQFCWGGLEREGALDIPRVVTAHSDVLSWATACNPSALAPSAWLARYVDLVEQGLKGSDAVTAPTRWMLNALAANFTLPERANVILNGAQVHAAERQSIDVRQRRMQIITAGRFWDQGKNLRALIDIDSPLPILVAGECDTSIQIETTFRPLGFLTEFELQLLFRSSALYLCPSVYEPFGLAPLEAALCGCALILHDLESLREVWGDAALYYRTAAELEFLLAALVRQPELIERTALLCHDRATQLGSAETVRSYEQLYEDLAANYVGKGGAAHVH